MTYNNAWEYEDHWDFDDISLDRMKEAGFKNETFYWSEGQA